MRVLFLVDRMGYPDGSTHGGTTYFMSTLPVLARSGVDLTVCFMAARHRAADALEAEGVEPIFLNRGKWDPRAFFDVLRIVREKRIDVLHLASLKSMLFGRWIARLSGAKSVIHIHDTSPMPPGMGFLERLSARWTDATIVLSESMRAWVAREFGIDANETIVVPNGIDTEPFRRAGKESRQRVRRELRLDDDARVVMVAGRVVPAKGQEHLIRAMPMVLKREPNAVACIVGDGDGRAACERIAAELGVSDRVIFTGYRTDIPEAIAAADVIAVPSLSECFGYSAIEAMAGGRPVVAFDVGGLTELIEDGESGLLVSSGDVAGLAHAVARGLTDQPLASRLARGGQRRAEQFTLESHVNRLRAVYESVCADAPVAPASSRPPPVRPQHSLGRPRIQHAAAHD